jgi:hypothetical protein
MSKTAILAVLSTDLVSIERFKKGAVNALKLNLFETDGTAETRVITRNAFP